MAKNEVLKAQVLFGILHFEFVVRNSMNRLEFSYIQTCISNSFAGVADMGFESSYTLRGMQEESQKGFAEH